MPEDQHPLERRRESLAAAISYVENQQKTVSRSTADFLDWARNELMFVETVLRQQRLLDELLAYRHAPIRVLAAA